MSLEELAKNRSAAYRMLIIEAGAVSVCGLLFFEFAGLEYTYSVVLGGLAFIVPNWAFVMFSFRASSDASGSSTLTWFYLGEAIKIITTIVIFAVSLLLLTQLSIGLMFVSYGVVLLINLVGLTISMK